MIRASNIQAIHLAPNGEIEEGLLQALVAIPQPDGSVLLVPSGGYLIDLGTGDDYGDVHQTFYAVVINNPYNYNGTPKFVGHEVFPSRNQTVRGRGLLSLTEQVLLRLPPNLSGFDEAYRHQDRIRAGQRVSQILTGKPA